MLAALLYYSLSLNFSAVLKRSIRSALLRKIKQILVAKLIRYKNPKCAKKY